MLKSDFLSVIYNEWFADFINWTAGITSEQAVEFVFHSIFIGIGIYGLAMEMFDKRSPGPANLFKTDPFSKNLFGKAASIPYVVAALAMLEIIMAGFLYLMMLAGLLVCPIMWVSSDYWAMFRTLHHYAKPIVKTAFMVTVIGGAAMLTFLVASYFTELIKNKKNKKPKDKRNRAHQQNKG